MPPQQNLSGSPFCMDWPHQSTTSSQTFSQFSAAPTHYVDAEYTPDQGMGSMGYSFAPQTPSFGLRDGFDESSSTRSSLSAPLSMPSVPAVQPVPIYSVLESRLPRVQDFYETSNGQSDQPHQWPMHPPPKPRKSALRSLTLTPKDWEEHRDEIKRLYKDEGRTLPDTIKIMTKNFGFTASIEQYKKQIKKWNWSKYLPANEASWMDNKAAKRKLEEKKDTIFEYRGQTYTTESLKKRFQKKKAQAGEATIKAEEATIPADEPTPSGMKYTTPGNNDTSPLNIVSPEMPAPQSGWTAASRSNTQHLHQLKLMWNGRTKTDLEAIFQEAQELERLAMIGDAEKKFREALDGFEYLLSATHEETAAVAYRLASFYAQNDRMKDADSVLDWVTEKHAERFGKGGSKTVERILHMVEIFRNWNRNDDAKALFSRIIDVLGEEGEDTDNEATHPPSSNSNSAAALPDMSSARTNPRQRRTSGDTTGALDCGAQPVVIDLQLGIAAGYIKTNDKEAEPFLLRLIEKCEAHPEDLSMQILRCKSALLALYHEDDRNKFNTALDQSKLSFWRFLNLDSEQRKTGSLLDAGAEIAKWHVKAGQYETADDMFIQIGSEAEKTFDADGGKMISLFQSIGFFYQNEERWDLAEPWFEQALAACYRNFADGSVVTKRLEAALENQRFDM